ncbi:MAG TPA: tetratricopeptide repeat protein [Anaeromyxobacteraceae bacterium]|nr:tetratricopeptide repeat protein [Anaeromyxobacteraceae bacterium]
MRIPVARSRSAAALAASILAACGGADRLPGREAVPSLATLASPAGPGADRLRAGDLAGARASFEAALSSDPGKLGALNDLAVSYVLEGHSDAARRLLDEVVANGDTPEQQAAIVNLGELLAADGYVSAAQAYFETARGLDGSRPEPLYALALLSDSRGDLDGARSFLRDAIRRDETGASRATFFYVNPEERVHLDALVAEQSGDVAAAQDRWRALAQGRYAALAAAAERHLAGE